MFVTKNFASLAAAASLAICSIASAAPATLQPNEAASKDTFVYSAIPSGLPFGSAAYIGASLESSGVHTLYSLIRFDTSSLSLGAGESATFNIAARSKAGTPFASNLSDPSATSPVTVDVYAVTSDWDEDTVTWSTRPTVAPLALTSFVVNSPSGVYSADITALVAAWITAPAANFGIELRQRAVVPVSGAPDAAVVFQSASGTIAPSLVIAVPEPTTLASVAGLSMLLVRRRSR